MASDARRTGRADRILSFGRIAASPPRGGFSLLISDKREERETSSVLRRLLPLMVRGRATASPQRCKMGRGYAKEGKGAPILSILASHNGPRAGGEDGVRGQVVRIESAGRWRGWGVRGQATTQPQWRRMGSPRAGDYATAAAEDGKVRNQGAMPPQLHKMERPRTGGRAARGSIWKKSKGKIFPNRSRNFCSHAEIYT